MESLPARPRAVIFDLGDVLFAWSANTKTTIPGRELRKILSTPIWSAYDRGEISRRGCYEQSAELFSFSADEIAEAFAQARKSVSQNDAIVSFIRDLKRDSSIKVYAMSNIGKEDFDDIASTLDCHLFDKIFTSAAAGSRKPEPDFYRQVLDQIGLRGDQVVFIDDKEDNIQAAQAFGIRGLVFGPSTIPALQDMINGPVARAWGYMFRNAQTCETESSTGIFFPENFSKLIVLDTLKDKTLSDLSWGSRERWNFYAGKNITEICPEGYFPDDLDTTSLALKTLRPSSDIVSSVLDTMMTYVCDDGNFQTYYDRDRHRVDPIVSTNILACFYSFGRGHELEQTLQVVRSMLLDRSYAQGTRYYPSPDCCLSLVGRLLRASDDAHLHSTLSELLESRVRERVGLSGDALDLAMRIMVCAQFGIACDKERQSLLDMQREDGGWDGGWIYQYGSTGMKVANRAATTAFAIVALST